MDKWLCEFENDLNLLVPTVVLGVFLDAFNAVVLLELEERLGRKLTDWDSQYLTREAQRKVEAETRKEKVKRWEQWQIDRQVIHDFIWNRG
jgi:hypothetical protein